MINFIAWVCVAVAAFSLFMAFVNGLLMRKLYGASTYQTCQAVTWLLGMQSSRILTLARLKWGCTIFGVYGIVRHFESSTSPFRSFGDAIVYAILLLLGCVQFFGQGRPAAILLLGASLEETLRFHGRLRDASWPHRVVSLLETEDTRSRNLNAGDCFRITFAEWERAIFRFMRSCVIIVIDVRIATPAVYYELQEIIRHNLAFKTILVGEPAGALPDELPNLGLHVETEEECCTMLNWLLREKMMLPSDVESLASLTERR